MDNFLNTLVLPTTRTEILLYTVDTCGAVLSIAWIANFEEGVSLYILGVTAISITITLGVKLHNLFTNNSKNKKL